MTSAQQKLLFGIITILLGTLCVLHIYYFYPWYFPMDDAYIVLHSAQVLHVGADPNYLGTPALAGNTSPVHLLLTSLLLYFLSPVYALVATLWLAIFLYAFGIMTFAFIYRTSLFHTILLLIISLLAGNTLFQLLNGVETGLTLASMVWALVLSSISITKLNRIWWAWLLGTLPFVRPELGILSLMLFIYQIERYWQIRNKIAFWSYVFQDIFVIFLAMAPWIIWSWEQTKTIYPLTILAKNAFFTVDFSTPFSRAEKFTLVFARYLLGIGVLLFPLLFLSLFTSLGRVTFIFITIFFGIYYFSNPNLLFSNYFRYLYPSMPILIYASISCLTSSDKSIRFIAHTFLIITALQTCLFLPFNWELYRKEIVNVSTTFPDYTSWCMQHIPKNETIVIQDAGYIAFATPFHLNDFVGLKTPHNIAYHEKLTRPSHGKLRVNAISEILAQSQAHYLIITSDWDKSAHLIKGLHTLGWKTTLLKEVKFPQGKDAYLIYYFW